MKKAIFSLALLLTCSLLGYAQKGISYQAVILDPKPIEIPGQDITGQPFVNGEVSLKFKLFSSTFVQEFEEVHVAKTDAYGLVNVLIGSVSQGAFSSLVWDSNPKNMQVWVSFDQGGTYTKVSEQVLTYNPYAIYAETAGKLGGTLGIAAGGTGATTAAGARTNLGLGNVDNTADAAKPISTATQAALDTKANASEVTTALATKANASDVTISLATKANANEVTTALATKANAEEVSTALATKANSAEVTTALATKANANEVTSALATKANAAEVTTALATKANASDVTTSLGLKEDVSNKANTPLGSSTTFYPTQNAVKTYVDAQVAAATIADASSSTKGKIQLAGDLAGTAAAPTVPGLALKANAADVTSALATKASTSDLTSGLALKANTADMTAALALKAPLASPTFTGTVTTAEITTGALSSTAVTAPTYASAPRTLTYSGSTINWNPALGLNAAITLTQNSTLSFTAAPPVGSYGTVVLTQDGTGGRTLTLPTLQGATNQVLGTTSTSTVALSTAASSKDILNFYYDGTIVYWNIGQGYGAASTTNSGPTNLASGVTGTLAVGNGGTGATTASAALTSLGGAPLASPTFTGAVTAPIYASAPQALTDGTTISWDPSLGLNASVTLGGDRTLSFTTTPTAGAYGTLVVTQDGTGSRTLTLPSTTNKVLGSTSTTTIALSSAAGAKDIINFYYDGTNCYWNVGQGYGAAATASTTNLASSVTGTLPVANGGTGAATLTGYVKGTGTTAMTASATIPVADVTGAAPLASPALTGTPTAPTAAANTNTTQLATTAFVTSAISTSGLPSQSGNNGKFLTTNGSTASWASSSAVPYSGASGVVNLGNYNLTVYGIRIGAGVGDNFALQYNTVIGKDALVNNSSGYHNIAIGNTALLNNTDGYANIAIGNESQGLNSSGIHNTSVGQATLYKNTGNYNTAVGSQAGYFIQSSGNTAVGYNALDGQGDGGGNTGVGFKAGAVSWDDRTYNSTFLGYNAKSQNGLENVIVIGYDAYTNEHHTIQLGDNRILKLKTSGTVWSNGVQLSSDVRLKTNIQPILNTLDLIMKLNPVHYNKKNSIESSDYTKTENGFIAQELQKVLPYLVSEGTDKDKILSVDYNSIIPVLTKGIQEQQALIEAQQKQIDEMKLILEKLMNDKK